MSDYDNSNLSQERLKELLHYDSDTGRFTWVKPLSNSARKNKYAGTLSGTGSISIGVNRKYYQAHRLAWLYVYGSFPDKHIDHINGIRDDNRIANLRLCDRSQNLSNRGKTANNTSGFKGVCKHKNKNKWVAKIGHKGVRHYLGIYPSKEEAYNAYCKAAKDFHGDFAHL